MSFHRVLPLLPALSDQALRDRWAIQPDTLISSKIMPDETPKAAASENQSPTPTPRSLSSPPEEGVQKSPGEESLEDYESPKYRTHSLSQAARTSSRPSRTEQLSVPRKSVVEKWQEDSPSSICLCQPDPKVPRPRNAFILYRQHHQQAVVAQNPGLANPEISKIIGDHWRNSSTENRDHWKLLAEEEKLRHQKQYPDYRYQPRRSTRNSSIAGPAANSAEGDQRRCQKCGGRSIAASTMMSGPGFPNPATPYSPNQPPNSATSAGRFMRSLGSPPTSNPAGNPAAGYRHRPSTANVASLTLSSPRYKRQDSGQPSPRFKRPEPSQISPRSPDPKRRRVTNASYAPVRAANNPTTPFPFPTGQRRQSLPRADFMGPSINSPFTMGPPPRPHHTQHHPETSLTLAPFHNPQSGGSSNNNNNSNNTIGIDTQAKSLEAMILSIPTLGKIRVLSKISPPLAPPHPASPAARRPRGLVVALDAADPAALDALTATVEAALSSHAPRVFRTPKPPPDAPATFQSYLRLMDDHHTLSAQIIDHITTTTVTTTVTTTERDADAPMDSPSPVSPKSFPAPKPAAGPEHPGIPVAIVPGWQVTWSDWFASRVEIRDAYSPMDHWQWGATLWRNVVGADVTVAVQAPVAVAAGPEPPSSSSPDGTAAGEGKGKGAGEAAVKEGPRAGHEKGRNGGSGGGGVGGGVEVRLEEARAVIVRGERDGGVAEGGLRRVGFEIGEWVRGWEEREERAARRGS
ncbi:hypothetical protein HO133_004682 [Letharia lupina]|uniref:HMG box domain-containing protein n=1 Tax=Letharia lupina TaxID=560253 RepID=A0A8H6KZY3_9LECA|nr:uncharacterized protein HO133_004682 [Letharia lupina]KAF6230342.1 hypothetical protein HO133_004682 [Letharia lupina]